MTRRNTGRIDVPNPNKCTQCLLEETSNAKELGDQTYLGCLMSQLESVPANTRHKLESTKEPTRTDGKPAIDIDPSSFSDKEKISLSGFSQSK